MRQGQGSVEVVFPTIVDPLRTQDFKYTYEIDEDFTPFPTMAVVSTQFDVVSPLMESDHVPSFSPFIILHAEQKLVMVKDKFEPGVEYTHEVEIIDVVDKGKNALVLYRYSSYTANDKGGRDLAFYNDFTILLKGLGGFGFKGKGHLTELPEIPKRKPDHILKGETYPGQALLYRLTGDINPLHVDPKIAKGQKFDRPIIHGNISHSTQAQLHTEQLQGYLCSSC